MNSIIRNALRSYRSSIQSVPSSAYSTVAEAVKSPPTEEPDKLYKTIEIEMRANEPAIMVSYSKFAQMAAEHLGITVGKCHAAPLPHYLRDKLCLLRSGFANKNCRVQYEVRTYYRYMNFHRLTGSTTDTFLEYIQRNLPEGIALKVTKVEVRKLPEDVVQLDSSQEATESTEVCSDSQS